MLVAQEFCVPAAAGERELYNSYLCSLFGETRKFTDIEFPLITALLPR